MSGVFARVLCGDDDSPAAREAARLAALVVDPGGALERVSVPEGGAGGPADGILAEIRRFRATLAAVGGQGHSRPVGIALGSVPTFLLHEAPCSVLVARATPAGPGPVVVGVDGSPQSALALAAAREVGERLARPVRPVAGIRDAHVDLDAARALEPELEERPESAVDMLAHLSEGAGLVVVGCRGLQGVRSLGSVSERVAHEARCPVLVVRAAA